MAAAIGDLPVVHEAREAASIFRLSRSWARSGGTAKENHGRLSETVVPRSSTWPARAALAAVGYTEKREGFFPARRLWRSRKENGQFEFKR
jgi:hypothetical protein